nr:putative l-type lectin-domain containing receptor kinase i.6 [Quercus suber]
MATVLTSPSFLIILYLISIPLKFAQDVNFIYNGFHQANLHLDGIAKIHPNGLLQLTNTSNQQVGYAFHPLPLKFNTTSTSSLTPSLSFSTNFVFAIVPQIPNLGAHGLTFTITPSWDFTHAESSQFLGLFNSKDDGLPANHILAIELDTLLNPELLDINKNHVGIDVNGVISVESAPASYIPKKEGKNISLDLLSGNPMHLWIDYDEAEKLLNVTLAPTSSSRPDQPLLSTPIDLSRVLLDSYVYWFHCSHRRSYK